MKLENKNQKLASVSHFAKRLAKYSLLDLVLITLSMGMGTFGYWYFNNTTILDSFYMASMILTGMGPVSEMTSDAAKIFSSLYALYSGVAFLTITAVFFTPIIHRVLHILHIDDEENS